jgi:dTDP-glucose 4,6-dehydratase
MKQKDLRKPLLWLTTGHMASIPRSSAYLILTDPECASRMAVQYRTFSSKPLPAKDLTIYGNGSQTRSFCYVTDLVEGIYRLLMSDQHEPVNIGNPIEMTIQQMANKILQASQSKSKIVQLPLPKDDPKTRQPNITLARKLLDWEPKVSLDEGLESTLEYFKQQINSS